VTFGLVDRFMTVDTKKIVCMKVNKLSLYIFIAMIMVIFSACKKEEGEGGKATIEGKLYTMLYDPNGKFLKKEEARKEDLFIIYGDNTVYDDQMDSDDEGSYKFQYLRKGDYTIFAYSDCNTCPSGIESVEIKVEIKDKKELVEAVDLEVVKNIDLNDGSGTVSGIVYMYEYSGPTLIAQYPKPDENVYIIYDNDQSYFDKTKSGEGGIFQFSDLIEGSYKIYAFSDCLTCTSGTEAKELQTEITIEGEDIQLSNLEIEKR